MFTENQNCPEHPQCGIWMREGLVCCSVCGMPIDPSEREKLIQAQKTKAVTVRTFALYRELVERTDEPTLPLEYFAGCLCEESGEFFGKVKRVVWHQYPMDEEMLLAMREELGDVLHHLDRCAHRIGTTLERIAEENDQKIKAIYPNGFSVELSKKRWASKRAVLSKERKDVFKEGDPQEVSLPLPEPVPWPENWLEYCEGIVNGLQNGKGYGFEFDRLIVAENVFKDIADRQFKSNPDEEIRIYGKLIFLDRSLPPGTVLPQ